MKTKANLRQINDFLACRKLAVVGASRDPKKFGHQVFVQLQKLGYELVPVNPAAETIEGIACIKSIDGLPGDVEAVCLITAKPQTDEMLRRVLAKGIKQVWVQQFSESPETYTIAATADANVVVGRCLFMYTRPEGVHKFHERITKLFGVYAS
jgi:uncharacterized protein